MISIILASMIQYDFMDRPVPERVARDCATVLGIPYGSDNITDEEWHDFQSCIRFQMRPGSPTSNLYPL